MTRVISQEILIFFLINPRLSPESVTVSRWCRHKEINYLWYCDFDQFLLSIMSLSVSHEYTQTNECGFNIGQRSTDNRINCKSVVGTNLNILRYLQMSNAEPAREKLLCYRAFYNFYASVLICFGLRINCSLTHRVLRVNNKKCGQSKKSQSCCSNTFSCSSPHAHGNLMSPIPTGQTETWDMWAAKSNEWITQEGDRLNNHSDQQLSKNPSPKCNQHVGAELKLCETINPRKKKNKLNGMQVFLHVCDTEWLTTVRIVRIFIPTHL